jgi:hypothetical protein
MTTPPKSRNEVNHDAISTAVDRLQVLLGDGATVVLLASWATGPNDTDSRDTGAGGGA